MEGESDEESKHIVSVSDDSHTYTNTTTNNNIEAETQSSNDHDDDHQSQTSQNHNGAAVKSVEGWNVFVRGLNEATGEDDLIDLFSKFGHVQIVRLNRERKTGATRCAIVEFANQREAQNAINALHGISLLERKIEVHWAFVNPTSQLRSDIY